MVERGWLHSGRRSQIRSRRNRTLIDWIFRRKFRLGLCNFLTLNSGVWRRASTSRPRESPRRRCSCRYLGRRIGWLRPPEPTSISRQLEGFRGGDSGEQEHARENQPAGKGCVPASALARLEIPFDTSQAQTIGGAWNQGASDDPGGAVLGGLAVGPTISPAHYGTAQVLFHSFPFASHASMRSTNLWRARLSRTHTALMLMPVILATSSPESPSNSNSRKVVRCDSGRSSSSR
jgi:hypothetical protein